MTFTYRRNKINKKNIIIINKLKNNKNFFNNVTFLIIFKKSNIKMIKQLIIIKENIGSTNQ